VEDGHVATRHAAGVGKPDRASPVMNTKATSINFNPYWTVPASIIKKDLIPKMQKEPSYLTDNRIRIIGPGGREIPPAQVNWRSDEATHYQFRQDPGGDVNSLGFVRINIGNPYGVYMHDTPSKGIFGDDFRFVSSGCVRVQNVRDYITWLLKDTPGWDRDKIEQALDGGQRIDANLTQPVPVYWIYVTAWAVPDGLVQFRDDIYNRDGLGNIPLASRAPIEPEDPNEAFMQN
jgi:L,D-transpeptidase YcbB